MREGVCRQHVCYETETGCTIDDLADERDAALACVESERERADALEAEEAAASMSASEWMDRALKAEVRLGEIEEEGVIK